MKEAIRKIICSIMPFLVESLYVKDRYDLKKIPVFFKAILLFLPSAFLYVVSNYKQSDKRKIKYWLPYGPMRNFEKKAYGSNLEKKKRFFIIRFIRYWLPYGYVLWWDNESQLSKKPAAPAAKPAAPAAANTGNANNNAAILAAIRTENEKTRILQAELAEKLEISLLKVAVELKNQNN